MQAIDAHQHFWKYNPVRDTWITDDMEVIRKDFMPDDLKPVLHANGIDGCVVVQSDQTEDENDFQLLNAEHNDFIKGVVGWVDLEDAHVEARLNHYSHQTKMKGFRHILQGETQRDFMLRPAFMKGIGLLHNYNFTYDLLVLPDQLRFTNEFVGHFPEQRFVVDHLAKPSIKNKKIDAWRRDMQALANHENVYCKLSGFITEADWNHWKPSDFTAYLDVIVEAFGPTRIMIGSDWPVCLVAGSYEAVLGVVRNYFSSFGKHEQQQLFGGNAITFYNL